MWEFVLTFTRGELVWAQIFYYFILNVCYNITQQQNIMLWGWEFSNHDTLLHWSYLTKWTMFNRSVVHFWNLRLKTFDCVLAYMEFMWFYQQVRAIGSTWSSHLLGTSTHWLAMISVQNSPIYYARPRLVSNLIVHTPFKMGATQWGWKLFW